MQHLGQILEKAVRNSGYSISKLAKRIGYTRQHMYNFFNQSKIDLAILDEVGKIIQYDFSKEIKSLKKYSSFENENTLSEVDLERKYLKLLEEHNALMKEHQLLLKQKVSIYFKNNLK